MTRHEARAADLPPGWAVRLNQHQGLQLYLADWARKPEAPTTPVPGSARYFRTFIEAADVAALADMLAGQKWVVTNVPADSEPDLGEIAFRQAMADVFGNDGELVRTAYGTFRVAAEGGRP